VNFLKINQEDMAAVMEPCVTLMLKSLQSTEGISLEVDGAADSNLPLEQLEDEEEEISLDDSTENALGKGRNNRKEFIFFHYIIAIGEDFKYNP
jgi:hypothetical protein